MSKLIYKTFSRHDIAEILQKLALNANQSIFGFVIFIVSIDVLFYIF